MAAEHDGVVRLWLAPLATMAFAWAIAWIVLLTMRASRYEPLYDLLAWSSGGPPWLLARFVVAAAAGLIGGAGIVVGVRGAGLSLDRRSRLVVAVGWALSYGIAHALVYLIVRAFDYAYFDELDGYLVFFISTADRPDLFWTRLADVLPATVGAGLLAYRFRREAPGAAAWIVIGWTLAAVLALLSVSVLLPAMERNFLGDLLSGPRRFGTGAGLVAGVISGLVGGWLTLWALRHASSGDVQA